ncbi:MAG: hypothetical protein WCF26_25160 [Candidatus Sulfotelmatobacter sp.]
MIDAEKTIKRIAIDLANLNPVDVAMQEFRTTHDLGGELSATGFPRSMSERFRLGSPDGRTLFLRDLAQRLWSGGGDEGGIEILQRFLFPAGEAAVDRVRIDWRRQRLAYQPKTTLQAVFYYLLQNSNLAKICGNPECTHRYFFGKRANERYCSDACFEIGQRSSKKNWWNEHGKEWREYRRTKP